MCHVAEGGLNLYCALRVLVLETREHARECGAECGTQQCVRQ